MSDSTRARLETAIAEHLRDTNPGWELTSWSLKAGITQHLENDRTATAYVITETAPEPLNGK